MTATQTQCTQVLYRQFPLRLPVEIADELDSIAARTRINKTTISRIALQKFIAELQQSGAAKNLDDVCTF